MLADLPETEVQKLQAERHRLRREVRKSKAWLLLLMLLCSVLYLGAAYWADTQERHMKDVREKTVAPVSEKPAEQPKRRLRLELLEPREAPNVGWGEGPPT